MPFLPFLLLSFVFLYFLNLSFKIIPTFRTLAPLTCLYHIFLSVFSQNLECEHISSLGVFLFAIFLTLSITPILSIYLKLSENILFHYIVFIIFKDIDSLKIRSKEVKCQVKNKTVLSSGTQSRLKCFHFCLEVLDLSGSKSRETPYRVLVEPHWRYWQYGAWGDGLAIALR